MVVIFKAFLVVIHRTYYLDCKSESIWAVMKLKLQRKLSKLVLLEKIVLILTGIDMTCNNTAPKIVGHCACSRTQKKKKNSTGEDNRI